MDRRTAFYAELIRLRSRRGVARPDLDTQSGSALRAWCGVRPSDTEARIRQSVISTLERYSAGLAPDLRQAARLALGLDKDYRYATLAERLTELACRENRSVRTGRRLMDQALAGIAAAWGLRVRRGLDRPGLTAACPSEPGDGSRR